MTREVDLVSYLPPFLAEFKEIAVTLEAENPEFMLVWNAAERVLQNQFIESADEYSLSRWEKMLGLASKVTDSLEDRRFRVLIRLNEELPYTLPKLRLILENLCGKDNFSAEISVGTYELIVKIGLAAKNNFDDVRDLLFRVVPSNMLIKLSQLYNTHAELKKLRYGQLAAYTQKQLREEVLTDG